MTDPQITRKRFYFSVAAVTVVLAALRLTNGDVDIAVALGVISLVLFGAGFLSRARG